MIAASSVETSAPVSAASSGRFGVASRARVADNFERSRRRLHISDTDFVEAIVVIAVPGVVTRPFVALTLAVDQ